MQLIVAFLTDGAYEFIFVSNRLLSPVQKTKMSSIFHVIKAASLDAERDVFLGVPIEGSNKTAPCHRVPVRSSNLENQDGHIAWFPLLMAGEKRKPAPHGCS